MMMMWGAYIDALHDAKVQEISNNSIVSGSISSIINFVLWGTLSDPEKNKASVLVAFARVTTDTR